MIWQFLGNLGIFTDPAGAFLQGCKSQGKKQRLLVGFAVSGLSLFGQGRTDGMIWPASTASMPGQLVQQHLGILYVSVYHLREKTRGLW